MKRNFSTIIYLLAFLIVFAGCVVKKMLKRAEQYESAGMFKDAAELYYKAYQKKPKKVDIKISLKRTGQIYLEEMSEKIGSDYRKGDYKSTVYDYMDASSFEKKMRSVNLNLKLDPGLDEYFEEAKNNYLDKKYSLGQKYLSEENYNEAKNVFTEISNIDPDYKDTRFYLKEAKYEPVYQKGTKLFGEGKYIDAYYTWNKILKQAGEYKDVKSRMNQALSERYNEGNLFLLEEKFGDAEKALKDVFDIDKAFENVKELYIEAHDEPIYRHGVAMLKQDKCRTAYYAFSDIIDFAGNYKDASTLRSRALECAAYPVAIQTPYCRKSQTAAKEFQSQITRRLTNLKNPFLKIYELSSLDRYYDQKIILASGLVKIFLANQIAEKHNIKAVLYCNFIEFTQTKGKLVQKKRTGFEKIPHKNSEGETYYETKKVSYVEYSQQNYVNCRLEYRLISTETGEILISDIISRNDEDKINYAVYGGNTQYLLPAYQQNGVHAPDENNSGHLHKLLKSRKRIHSIEQLTNDVFLEISQKIANRINRFNPEQ